MKIWIFEAKKPQSFINRSLEQHLILIDIAPCAVKLHLCRKVFRFCTELYLQAKLLLLHMLV